MMMFKKKTGEFSPKLSAFAKFERLAVISHYLLSLLVFLFPFISRDISGSGWMFARFLSPETFPASRPVRRHFWQASH